MRVHAQGFGQLAKAKTGKSYTLPETAHKILLRARFIGVSSPGAKIVGKTRTQIEGGVYALDWASRDADWKRADYVRRLVYLMVNTLIL